MSVRWSIVAASKGSKQGLEALVVETTISGYVVHRMQLGLIKEDQLFTDRIVYFEPSLSIKNFSRYHAREQCRLQTS